MKKFILFNVSIFFTILIKAQIFAPEIKVKLIENDYVGIGISQPQASLHLCDKILKFRIERTNSDNPGYWDFYISQGIDNQGSLYLKPSQTDGDFIVNVSSGNVGIGISEPEYKLEVDGTVRATTFSAESPPWADFVFEPNYDLRSLNEVHNYIKEHKHLPDLPTEQHVKEKGIDLAQMNAILLQKIEELTLYTIEQQKRIEELEKQNSEIEQIKEIIKRNGLK